MSRPRKTVELLGAGISMGTVPEFLEGAERWGTNAVMFRRYSGHFDQWTRWFDLHRTPHILTRRPEAYDWYRQQDGSRPIYQWEVNPEIPGSRAYPLAEIQRFFGDEAMDARYPERVERDFWGSLSWMLALAIYEGFEAIDLFWFVVDTQCHEKQIPSVRYWIGQARGRGIRVTVHGDSTLKPSGLLYGCETT